MNPRRFVGTSAFRVLLMRRRPHSMLVSRLREADIVSKAGGRHAGGTPELRVLAGVMNFRLARPSMLIGIAASLMHTMARQDPQGAANRL
jgi:hypothetical protein